MSDGKVRIHLVKRLQARAGRRARSGQAMTEFAIVVPLLLLLIYAIIIFALAIHTQIDFGNAISTAMRRATVLGNGSILPPAAVNTGATSPNPNLEDVDALIGQSLLQNLRSDDAHSVDSFDLQLQQSRLVKDAFYNPDGTGTPQNIYKNTYCAIPAPAGAPAACRSILAAALRPYGPGSTTFDQNAWNFIQASGISADPCTYYFEAHQAQVYTYDSVGGLTVVTRTTYLDKGEQIILHQEVQSFYEVGGAPTGLPAVTPLVTDPRYPDPTLAANATLQAGCGRVYYVENRPTGSRSPALIVGPVIYKPDWDCTYANTIPATSYLTLIPFTTSHFDHTAVGHTCYYYQNERNIDVSSDSDFPLPDLVELGLNYHYDPIPTEISSRTPLGGGFSLREHAQGRLEPAPLPGG